jgi:hypothetical protein
MEELLQKLVSESEERIDAASENGMERKISGILEKSLGIDVLTPNSNSNEQWENAPVLSLFDNIVVSRCTFYSMVT